MNYELRKYIFMCLKFQCVIGGGPGTSGRTSLHKEGDSEDSVDEWKGDGDEHLVHIVEAN
jgi:hypothetical protein